MAIRLGMLGLGNIGGEVLRRLDAEPIPGVEVVAACDVRPPAEAVADVLARRGIPLVAEPAGLLERSTDWVLEAAGLEAARDNVLTFLERGVSVMVMSSGGLVCGDLWRRAASLCRPEGPRLWIPSGAVGGLDIVRAAAEGGLRRVHLRTVKPAESLDRGKAAEGPTVLFSGTAAEAVTLFPRNVNVAASLALAGIGPERTTVEVVADPAAAVNTHHVTVEGDFGTADLTFRNLPSPGNPRTSLLAILSVIAALRRLGSGLLPGA